MSTHPAKKDGEGRARSTESRVGKGADKVAPSAQYQEAPAAGAHAAHHLTNEDATPGAGALPSQAHRSGKEVDGAAG